MSFRTSLSWRYSQGSAGFDMLGGAIVGDYETVPGMLTARWRVRRMSTAVPLYACVMF